MQHGGESTRMVDGFWFHTPCLHKQRVVLIICSGLSRRNALHGQLRYSKVKGTGKICLKMTSGKVLTLNNVLYVPEFRRNLISVSLLDKNGFKCVTVSGKIVVSKGEMYTLKLDGSKISNLPIDRVHPMNVQYGKFKGKPTYPDKLSNLKHLDLGGSLELTKTPNFGDMPILETLNLWHCENLEEVHPSIGHCKMLTSLILYGCVKLKKLPKFVTMESLETLLIDECISLEEFPEICGDMLRLSKLGVGSPWIRSLPPSLSALNFMKLRGGEVLESIPDASRNLESLYIEGCNKLATLPNSVFESQQLEYLSNISRSSKEAQSVSDRWM
ncbi:hypothetical protein FXO38_29778 [Capsicum annuum]|nr:hypothetical protein FXO38_29778 [Capsicum annuum]